MDISTYRLAATLAPALAMASFAAAQASSPAPAPTPTSPAPIARHYTDGETLTYQMRASNESWTYQVKAKGVVKKDPAGHFVEEFTWTDFNSSAPMGASPQNSDFRQILSLDPAVQMSIPDLSKAQPALIGPITDLLTFYSDLWLAIKLNRFRQAGDHAYIPFGGPSSWADGTHVILGEDSIDFDLTLKDVDMKSHIGTLLARHVPPAKPKVKLPAAWMQQPVSDTPNNFVNVEKKDKKYEAEVGKEIFDDEIKFDLSDGKILSATMNNPVQTSRRTCSDAALTDCGEAAPHSILRQIEIRLIP